MSRLRWGKFYWSDWEGDTALALCSHAAQGLWMRLLCIAAQGTPYGHVTVGGKPPSDGQIKILIRQPNIRLRDLRRLIDELERNGVARRTEAGVIYSLRMVRDFARAEHASKAARARHDNKRPPESTNENRHATTTPEPRQNHARTTENAKNGGFGRANVAGATVEAEAEASYLSQERDKMLLPQETGEQRGVRLNGARAAHPLLTEAKGSDEYLHNLLQTIQANGRPS